MSIEHLKRIEANGCEWSLISQWCSNVGPWSAKCTQVHTKALRNCLKRSTIATYMWLHLVLCSISMRHIFPECNSIHFNQMLRKTYLLPICFGITNGKFSISRCVNRECTLWNIRFRSEKFLNFSTSLDTIEVWISVESILRFESRKIHKWKTKPTAARPIFTSSAICRRRSSYHLWEKFIGQRR